MQASKTGNFADIKVENDRKECPNCKRKFNAFAAEKHIRSCAAKNRQKGIRVY